MSLPPLDPLRLPLRGTHLVEASAGTGKTWTIGALLLRLLAQEGLALPEILVITFTEAAAAELRHRLRRRLAAAVALLENRPAPDGEEDGFVAELRAALEPEPGASPAGAPSSGTPPGALTACLRQALAAFDEASVFTIHGFCQRVLAEHALALGLPATFETGPAAAAALRVTALDGLRRWWHRLPPALLGWLSSAQGRLDLLDPGPWLDLVERHGSRAASLPPDPLLDDLDAVLALVDGRLAAHGAAVDALRAAWPAEGAAALARILLDSALKRNVYQEKSVRQDLSALAEWLAAGCPEGGMERAGRYVQSRLADPRHSRGGAPGPEHPAFAALEEVLHREDALRESFSQALEALQRQALRDWPAAAARRRLDERRLSFDDLLHHVRDGLAGPGGGELALRLRRRWRAALVDEYQDTDPVQAEILFRLFHDGGLPLVLVGDPKQSIYGFRGADLDCYLEAAGRAEGHGLSVNWRSTPRLVGALNRLLDDGRLPAGRGVFLTPGISAPAVAPSPRAGREVLRLAGRPLPALLAVPAADGARNRAVATRDVTRHLAALLRRLLAPAPGEDTGWAASPSAPARAVEGGEVAVLVRTHAQGQETVAALAQEGLACIQGSRRSVWESLEAEELVRLLDALARPADAGRARALLAGPFALAMGLPPERALVEPGALERLQRELHETRREAAAGNLAAALARLLRRLDLAVVLLGLGRGERRWVNWTHLLELLRREEEAGRPDPAELALRLRLRRAAVLAGDGTKGEGEEDELRLESDDRLVRVLTVHKAKGLEFPLVCCPFLWVGERGDGEFGALLQRGVNGDPQLRPVSRARPPADEEALERGDARLAEGLRLAYVALTRAKAQVVVHHGPGRWGRNAPGPLDWLLLGPRLADAAHPGDPAAWRPLAERAAVLQAEAWAELSDAEGIGQAEPGLPAGPSGTAAAASVAAPFVEAAPLAPREAGPPPAPGPRISSFSSLMAGGHAGDRLEEWFGPEDGGGGAATPADDSGAGEEDLAGGERAEGGGAGEGAGERGDWPGAFPRGAAAGTCLHLILERPDLVAGGGGEERCRHALRTHGLDPALAPGTARWLREVLAAPLDASGFRLADLAAAQWAAELEFHLPVQGAGEGWLAEPARRHGLYDAARLGAAEGETLRRLAQAERGGPLPLPRGFLKGYIDQVHVQEGRWWVLDWKSNHLGPAAACYTREAMLAEMLRAGYLVQGLLYLVALHRHLGATLPGYEAERHLGGLRYLFLRGVAPSSPGTGVFADRPPLALVRELDRILGEGR